MVEKVLGGEVGVWRSQRATSDCRGLAKGLSLLCHYLLLFDGRIWKLSTREGYDVGEV